MSVGKKELVALVANTTSLTTHKAAEEAVDAVLAGIGQLVVEHDSVRLVGFGTFDVRERKERTGRNPRDPKETINIPASKAPVFKAGKALKETVNK